MIDPALPPWPDTPPAADGVLLRAVTDDDVKMVRDLASDPYVPLIGRLSLTAGLAHGRAEVGYAVAPAARGSAAPRRTR